MGTEYFLVKPSKKEYMCIGKHLNHFSGIVKWCHSGKPKFIEYECFKDLVTDIIEETDYFTGELPFGIQQNFLYNIYEWCDAPVYLDNDCSMNKEWMEYKEVPGIYDFYKKEIPKLQQERLIVLEDLIGTLPKQYRVMSSDRVIDSVKTLQKYIKEKENDRG